MSVIYCPDFINWYGKTDPKGEWYHSMGWRPRLTKREKASCAWAVTSLLPPYGCQCDQLLPVPACDFPAMMDSIPSNCELNTFFIKLLCLITSLEKQLRELIDQPMSSFYPFLSLHNSQVFKCFHSIIVEMMGIFNMLNIFLLFIFSTLAILTLHLAWSLPLGVEFLSMSLVCLL